MQTHAVIFEEPGKLLLDTIDLATPGADDVVIESHWSGISTGTERLLWSGEMPSFPGMGYPLVPGYETVGTIVEAPAQLHHRLGERVFVPGSSGYAQVRGLFGGTASTLLVSSAKAHAVDKSLGPNAVLMALAATAQHALSGGALPDLVVGHGVLGRLMARLVIAHGGKPPTVWEADRQRRSEEDYRVIDPQTDEGVLYRTILDVSGDSGILDGLVNHLMPGGEIVLAGFYSKRMSFAFPPAFMKEARIRVAAEWKAQDLDVVSRLLGDGSLSFDGLITHEMAAKDAARAYETAFGDPECLKMVLKWGETQ